MEKCLNPLNQVYVFNRFFLVQLLYIKKISLNPLNQVYVFNSEKFLLNLYRNADVLIP